MQARMTRACGFAMAAVLMLGIGFAIGRGSNGGAAGASGTPETLGTPAAALTPCVAPTMTPTPSPTSTPSPTPTATLVPPAAAATPMAYAGGWTVNVLDISLLTNFAGLAPTGVFVKVSLSITNDQAAPRAFPYDQLVLLDAKGRPFVTPLQVKTSNEAGWYAPFPPSLPTNGFVIFDIAADSAGPFILQSTADPTFRVQIAVQARG